MSGIYRPGMGCVQRVTANAGNRRFIRGGKLLRAAPTELGPLAKAVILAKVLTPDLPDAEGAAPAKRARKPKPADLQRELEADEGDQ